MILFRRFVQHTCPLQEYSTENQLNHHKKQRVLNSGVFTNLERGGAEGPGAKSRVRVQSPPKLTTFHFYICNFGGIFNKNFAN